MWPDSYTRTYGDRPTLGDTSATRLRQSNTAFRTNQRSRHNDSHTSPGTTLNTRSSFTILRFHAYSNDACGTARIV
jgi:hypothetical protein